MEFSNLENILDLVGDLIVDAALDTLYIVPFLFITYLILEFIEHRMSEKSQSLIKKAGVGGPAIGSLLGLIPQCGFSSVASTFYAGRVITLGTLIAVYLSTSDEMIPVFLAGGIPLYEMLLILLAKFIIGMFFGFAIDLLIRFLSKRNLYIKSEKFAIHEICERDNCSCDDHHSKNIVVPALLHTLQVSLFVFVITIVLNALIEGFGGEEILSNIVADNKYVCVFLSALVGIIPNCAASVIISQLYIEGVLGLGALMAGLLNSAGIGLLVLFKTNRPVKKSVLITIIMYGISVFVGLIICSVIG